MADIPDSMALEAYNIKLMYPESYMEKIIDYLALSHIPYEQARHRAKRVYQRGEKLSLLKAVNSQEESIIQFDDVQKMFADSIQKNKGLFKLLIKGDTHLPFENKHAVQLGANVAHHFKPHMIIDLGDLFDFTEYSRFEQLPQFANKDLMDESFVKLKRYSELYPNVSTLLLCGNHEHRLLDNTNQQKNKNDRKAVIKDWYSRLKELGISFGGFKVDSVHYKTLLRVSHGRRHSQYTANKNLHSDNYGFTLGISGHTHRSDCQSIVNEAGTFTSISMGAMCTGQPTYNKSSSPMSWDYGCCTVIIDTENNTIYYENLKFVENNGKMEVSFGGTLLSSKD